VKKLRVLVTCAALVFEASPVFASQFDQFVGFGDSTIDSGWWSGALLGQCGAVAGPCTTGNAAEDTRIKNAIANGGTGAPVGVGLMNSQILAGMYGLTATPANQTGGTNYAISGSKNAVSDGLGNLNPNANLPSTVGQIGSYLAKSGTANPNALYLVSSGGNDITFANNNFNNLASKEAYLTAQISSLVSELHTLQGLGAQHILVHGVQGSGLLATFYDQTLLSQLAAAGVHVVYSDIAALIQTVEANPTAYGFTAETVMPGVVGPDTGSACVAGGGTGWGQWCGNTTKPNPNFAHLRSADSEQTSFFSDDQHLSAAGQLIEAQYDYNLLQGGVPEPSTWAMLIMGFAGIGLMNYRRRKASTIAA
jgi:outer membrane lipase/esterase